LSRKSDCHDNPISNNPWVKLSNVKKHCWKIPTIAAIPNVSSIPLSIHSNCYVFNSTKVASLTIEVKVLSLPVMSQDRLKFLLSSKSWNEMFLTESGKQQKMLWNVVAPLRQSWYHRNHSRKNSFCQCNQLLNQLRF